MRKKRKIFQMKKIMKNEKLQIIDLKTKNQNLISSVAYSPNILTVNGVTEDSKFQTQTTVFIPRVPSIVKERT